MRKIISAITAAALSVVSVCTASPVVTQADNPIVQTSFTPDPAPVVIGDELYVFTGCDRDGSNDFYYMTGWQCFSTKDMKNWTDHGRILEDTSFSWCNANDAWASQCIERNGKFYFYFTTTNKSGGGRAIGVAVADSPEGPYSDPLGKPLCGPNWDYIDPTVIIDDDGQAWLMFGNPKCYYVKLKEDMVTLDGQIRQFDMNTQQFGSGSRDTGTTYGEGPWIYKHKSLYYLVWASFVDGFGGESQCYATGPSATGPWTYRGVIQQGSNCYTTHGGIIDYKDHSYFFYHKNGLPGGGAFNRSAACEEFSYNSDGTIPVIKPTDSGPSQLEALDPFKRVEAETICRCEGVKTEKDDTGAVNVGYIKKGSYIKVAGVDFREGADKFTASVASGASGGNIELRLDSKSGPVIGTLKVGETGGWHEWQQVSCDVSGASGEHDLYLVFNGGDNYLMNVDWWRFDGAGSASSENDDTYLFKNSFEGSLDGCSDRGGSTVAVSSSEAYSGKSSAYCSGRTSSWQGVGKSLNYKFKAGESYSFSAMVKYKAGDASTKFHLTLQYKGTDGETHYDKIDTKTAAKGKWTQLANRSYKIPNGASELLIYVETEGDSGDSRSPVSFYVDDLIAAADGTFIDSPSEQTIDPKDIKWGDANADGRVDMNDAVLVRQSLASPSRYKLTEQGRINADVYEAGGGISKEDADTICKYLAKMIPQLPESYSENEVPEPENEHLSMKDFTEKVKSGMVEKEPDSANRSQSGVTYGEIVKKSYYSTTCNRQKDVNILLPPNYDPAKKYPVMYIMHGYYEGIDRMLTKGNAEMHTREMIGNAIAEGAAKEMICVFPDVYSSPTQKACSGMDEANNQAYDNFINDLTKDLMPYIESNYSIKTGKDNTAITGFSMGGRESLLIGMKRPDLFGYIGAICPAPGVSGAFKWSSDNEPYLLMLTAGDNDKTVYNIPENYHNNFEKNGVPHIWHYVKGGYHGDNCIRAHLYNFFRAAFQN